MTDIDSIVHTLCHVRYYIYTAIAAACIKWQWQWHLVVLVLGAGVEGFYQFNQRSQRDSNFPGISQNDIALVTGGSRGLGSEIVSILVMKKCRVIVLDIEPYVPKDRVLGDYVSYIHCDLASVEMTQSTISQVVHNLSLQKKYISVLINNAGVRHNGSFLSTDQTTLSRVFNVNTFSPAIILRTVLRAHVTHNRHKFLSVVNVSSILGTFGPCNLSAYSGSKAAYMQFHECLSEELRPYPEVRMLLVLPGQLDTVMFGDVIPSRQFVAPVVDHRILAQNIVARVEQGGTGVMCEPLYANFLPAIKVMPMTIQRLARWFSKMDEKIIANENH